MAETTMTVDEIKPWIDLLAQPTMGVIVVVVVILYKDAVVHLIKTVIDVVASWLKK
jgi:hypothetical protein